MRKLKKRKTDYDRCQTHYEINTENRQRAIEVAENTPGNIKKPVKYDLKN